jgi:CheY-like chemotaxis protein
VLLVDDDAGDQYLVRRALSDDPRRADLLVIDDGDTALDYLLHRGVHAGHERPPRPDLLLLDLNLPGADGFSILATARGDERLRSLPIVVISTSSRESDIEESYRLGCNAYVIKPDSASGFIDVIHAVYNYWLDVNLPSSS